MYEKVFLVESGEIVGEKSIMKADDNFHIILELAKDKNNNKDKLKRIIRSLLENPNQEIHFNSVSRLKGGIKFNKYVFDTDGVRTDIEYTWKKIDLYKGLGFGFYDNYFLGSIQDRTKSVRIAELYIDDVMKYLADLKEVVDYNNILKDFEYINILKDNRVVKTDIDKLFNNLNRFNEKLKIVGFDEDYKPIFIVVPKGINTDNK